MRIEDGLSNIFCTWFLLEPNQCEETYLERLDQSSTHREKAILWRLVPTVTKAF